MASDQRVNIMLARRVDVFRAIGGRHRLLISWVLQAGLWATWIVAIWAGVFERWIVQLVLPASGAVFVWSALEATLLQRALREPLAVQVATFLGTLFPPAAPILATVMFLESVAVLRIARRMRRDECPHCGYDLRGITSMVCPECGWKMEHVGGRDVSRARRDA